MNIQSILDHLELAEPAEQCYMFHLPCDHIKTEHKMPLIILTIKEQRDTQSSLALKFLEREHIIVRVRLKEKENII